MTYKDKGKVALGYSKDFSYNKNWKKEKLFCGYEHCIEHSPILIRRVVLSCPVFGHNCPGGIEKRKKCKSKFPNVCEDGTHRKKRG